MTYQKRTVEHYKDHELVCITDPGPSGWTYEISIVSHSGDDSYTRMEKSEHSYSSEIDALQAGMAKARALVDEPPAS